MSYGVSIRVRGDYACFTRPEMKVERVSYDVMTPSAARGILTAIYWKPQIAWLIDRIHVINPIVFTSIRRNEVSAVASTQAATSAMKGGTSRPGIVVEDVRQQRAAVVLRDVEYVIDAHFELVDPGEENSGKHSDIFRRRLERGQCFHMPYLGTREFACSFESNEQPQPETAHTGDNDLGWMLYDIDFSAGKTPLFFRAKLIDGVLDVAAARQEGLSG